jgi:hypothetical protein
MKIRRKFQIESKQKEIDERAGVVMSINKRIDPTWLDELLTKRENIYKRWSIKSAFINMPVWIAESGVGISSFARVGEINYKSTPMEVKLVNAEKIDRPIGFQELRDYNIINKTTPRTIKYLSKEQVNKLDDLFK